MRANHQTCSSSAPAITTTPVVPSPISWSWLFESSTRSLPIWCSTSICSRMVAPSFAAHRHRTITCHVLTQMRFSPPQDELSSLMQTSPSGLCSILSMPLGPRDDCSILEIAFAAWMLAFCASIPRIRCFFSCSC